MTKEEFEVELKKLFYITNSPIPVDIANTYIPVFLYYLSYEETLSLVKRQLYILETPKIVPFKDPFLG